MLVIASMNFFLVMPGGILVLSTHLFRSLRTLIALIFLNLESSIFIAMLLRPSENIFMSTNLGSGVTFPSSDWNRYVARPQWGWAVKVTLFWDRNSEAKLDIGATTGTGYQSSGTVYPVC